MTNTFRRYIVVISGFTQSLGQPNGTHKLYSQLLPFNSPRTQLKHLTWNTDMAEQAELMWHLAGDALKPKVVVFAYSWGCGWGFRRLAIELDKRGIQVAHAVLCDPVYRSPFLPKWLPFNPLSMFPASTPLIGKLGVKIPDNVQKVDWFYQRKNVPQGRQLRFNKKHTDVAPGIELGYTHQNIEDSKEWRDRCVTVAQSL